MNKNEDDVGKKNVCHKYFIMFMQDRILKKNELLYPNCIKFFYVEKL